VDTFWGLLRESVIFQGVLVLLLGIAYVYMLVSGMAIPADFSQLMGVVVGFFFGGKVATASRAASQESLKSQVQLTQAQADLARSVLQKEDRQT
jgi:hypothetical protein